MTMFNKQFSELVKVTLQEWQQLNDQTDGDESMQVMDKSTKSQDFFQDNNALGKRYTTTHIKSRNFLCKIVYVGIDKENYYNENFVFDVYLVIIKNLNLVLLDRKLGR